MMETEGLGGVDRKANDSADMKRGGRRIPHSELQFDDFSLASLTSFPEKLRKFEKENGAAWDRDFLTRKSVSLSHRDGRRGPGRSSG